MFRSLLILIALLAGADAALAETCRRNGTYHFNGGNYPMFISIRSGESCESTFGSFGGAAFVFKRLWLVSQPTRGKLRLREGGYYMYSAPAGYKGTDQFKLRVCGTQNDREGCADLQYTVTID